MSYEIIPGKCSGCALCVDICEMEAVAVKGFGAAERGSVALFEGRCHKCGVPFHLPLAQVAAGKEKEKADPVAADVTGSDKKHVCRICNRRDHTSRLFQVYD
jgi:ferredoxin